MSAGYSGKPLWQKLGIEPGTEVHVTAAPQDYPGLVGTDVVHVRLEDSPRFVHAFFTSADALRSWLEDTVSLIGPDVVVWLSWPKKSSGVASDVDEDLLRDVALPLGLVDVKVCAVDAVWSALKFVVRKDRRADWNR